MCPRPDGWAKEECKSTELGFSIEGMLDLAVFMSQPVRYVFAQGRLRRKTLGLCIEHKQQ